MDKNAFTLLSKIVIFAVILQSKCNRCRDKKKLNSSTLDGFPLSASLDEKERKKKILQVNKM